MNVLVERLTGRTMIPLDQTGGAKALWAQPNRPFGNPPPGPS
jgi:hypothetical protein